MHTSSIDSILGGRWAGVVKSLEKKKSVTGQFAVKCKSETYCWTQKLNRKDYGVDKDFKKKVLLAVGKE